jgi:spermidine synthase
VQILRRLTERSITANAIVPWHIEQKLHPGWQGWFSQFIAGSRQKINHDFKPLGLFYSISHWNALYAPSFGWLFKQFERINLWFILLLFALFLLLYFFLRSRKRYIPSSIPFSIITTGFAGMIFDIVVIFAFQSIYGYVFSWIGLLVAAFMAGAACGAMLITMALEQIQNGLKFFIKIEVAILCFSVVLPFLLFAVNAFVDRQNAFILSVLPFLAISLICGLLIGSQFPLANKLSLRDHLSTSRTVGLLYAADLAGGWLGGIVGAVVLLPVLGLTGTCLTVGLLKLASFIVLATQPQSVSV